VFKCGLNFIQIARQRKSAQSKNVFTITLTEPISINKLSNR